MNLHRGWTLSGRGLLALAPSLSLLLDPGCAGAPPRDDSATAGGSFAVAGDGRTSRSDTTAPWRVVVLDPKKSAEVPEPLVQAFAEVLQSEVRKLLGVSSLGMPELRALRDIEEQKQKYCRDCADSGPRPDPRAFQACADDACLAAAGGAQGFDEVLRSSVSREGAGCLVALARIDVARAATILTVAKVVPKRDGAELLDIVCPLVAKAYPEAEFPLKEGASRGVEGVRIPKR